MAQNSIQEQGKHKVHSAALALAGARGWADLTPAEVLKAAKLKNWPHKAPDTIWQILFDILSTLDATVQTDVQERLGDSWRDNLFELLMTRFDQMQPHRKGYLAIMPSLLAHPRTANRLTRRLLKSMAKNLDLSGMPTGKRKPLLVVTLTAIYLSLIDVWRQDETADLSKTMAAVDQRLNWLEEVRRLGRKGDAHT